MPIVPHIMFNNSKKVVPIGAFTGSISTSFPMYHIYICPQNHFIPITKDFTCRIGQNCLHINKNKRLLLNKDQI